MNTRKRRHCLPQSA